MAKKHFENEDVEAGVEADEPGGVSTAKEKMGPYVGKMSKGGKAKGKYKRGGKVHGDKAKMRPDKMPHKSYGGQVEGDISTSTGVSPSSPIASGGKSSNK